MLVAELIRFTSEFAQIASCNFFDDGGSSGGVFLFDRSATRFHERRFRISVRWAASQEIRSAENDVAGG